VLLSSETKMPMMYMDDAIAATIKLCKRQQNRLKSVPLITAAMSFTPTEIAAEIKNIPEFTISYKPDFRQKTDSWPAVL
jgi:hypothetical protein